MLIDLSVLIRADASLIIKRQMFVSIGGPAINWKSNPRLHQSYMELTSVATMYNSSYLYASDMDEASTRKNLLRGARTLYAFDIVF